MRASSFLLLCTLAVAPKIPAEHSGRLGPEVRQVKCETTAGAFTMNLDPTYSPKGVNRVLNMVRDNFFDGMLLYRVLENFLVQFGVAATPKLHHKFSGYNFNDEPNKVPFRKGTISFAGNGVDSRSCHLFVALNAGLGNAKHETTLGHLDDEGIATFERVVSNHKAASYGDTGHLQAALAKEGNSAAAKYPRLDSIRTCELLPLAKAEL